jgi:hypothetical protein
MAMCLEKSMGLGLGIEFQSSMDLVTALQAR